jgi:HEAT repeat protein
MPLRLPVHLRILISLLALVACDGRRPAVAADAAATAAQSLPNTVGDSDPLLETHRTALYLDKATDESRVLAAKALLLSAEPKARQIIRDALAVDQPVVVRRAVAAAISQLRSESPTFQPQADWIDPLFAAMGDARPALRDAAAHALADYDQPAVLNRLIQAATSKDAAPVRLAAIRALGWSVRKPAAETLIVLLSSSDASVRAEAIRALIEMTDRQDLGTDETAWLAWWADLKNQDEQSWERDLLRRRGRQVQKLGAQNEQLTAALDEITTAHYMLLAPSEQAKVISDYLSRDLAAFNIAGARLVRRYALAGGKVPAEIVQRLLLLVNNEDPAVRAAVIVVLPDTGDGELVAAVLGRLSREVSAQVRIAIAESLGRWADPRAVAPLLGLLKDDQQSVAISAVNALGAIATAHRTEALAALEPLHELAHAATAAGNDRLLEAIILSLGKIADRRSVPVLMEAMDAGSAKARLAAVVGLGRIGDPSVTAGLTEHLDDADAGVREQVVLVLAALGSAAQLPALEARAEAEGLPAESRTRLWDAMRQILRRQERDLAAAGSDGELVAVRRRLAQTLVKLGNLNEALALYAQCAEQLKDKPKELADLQGERLWVLLTADQAEAFAVLLADLLRHGDEAGKAAIRDRLEKALQARLDAGSLRSTLALMEQMASKVPAELFGDEAFSARLAAMQKDTAQKLAAADQKELNETIERLASAEEGVWKAAAEALMARGKTVVPALLAALKADIQKNPGQPLFQTRIFDILKTLSAERFGYDPQAPDAERIEAIDRWLKASGSPPAGQP